MKPPAIGEAISAGLKAFKANLGPTIVGFLCAWVLGLIPLVGGMLALPGFFNVGLKAVRGQKAEPKDGFVAFDAAVDHIVMGLLQICGLIACCIGVWITQPLFLMGTPMILDKKMNWTQAKDQCLAQVKPNFIAWFVFTLVVGLFGGAPMIAAMILNTILGFVIEPGTVGCVIAVALFGAGFAATLFTMPAAMCAFAYAYDKSSGSIVAAPPAPPAPTATPA